EKGKIARSRDLALAGASVAATIALARAGKGLISGLAERLAGDLSHFGDAATHTIAPGDLTRIVVQDGVLMARLVAPVALATMFTGVAVHGFQGGWSFTPTN